MKKIVDKILNIGIHDELSKSEIKLIKVLNFICFAWYGVSVLFMISDLLLEEEPMKFIIAHSSASIMLTTVLYLQSKRKYDIAKIVFISTSYFIFYSFSIILDPGHLVEFYYILLLIFSILSIGNKNLHYFFFIVTIFGIIGPPNFFKLYDDEILSSLPTKSILIFSIFILIQYFKKLYVDSETELEKGKEKINSQKEELRLAYIKLEETKKHELAASNLRALKSQMNPHFIFNSINSIQNLVLTNDSDNAFDYLVEFSIIVRNILDFSEREFISLEEEFDFLKTYLNLEKLRFGDDLEFDISLNVLHSKLRIPSLIIQPFVENAINHGLHHKQGDKRLKIIIEEIESEIQCTIIDNGIGIEKVREIQARQNPNHVSFSSKAIKKRLELLQEQTDSKAGYEITTLYNSEKNVKGTKVVIILPTKPNLQNNQLF